MRLIFATNNQNKLREIKEILGEKYKDFIFSTKDIGIYVEPDENGKDFTENADIKVKALFDELVKYKKLEKDDYIISDDTGLCVDFLDGAPGIYSSRYMGEATTQDTKNNKIIELLEGVKGDGRNAHFITVLSVMYIDNINEIISRTYEPNIMHFKGRIDGKISEKIDGTGGFGYDPIFEVNGVTYSKMGKNGKNSISHRSLALAKFVEYLEKNHNI